MAKFGGNFIFLVEMIELENYPRPFRVFPFI